MWFPKVIAVDVDGTLLANNLTMDGMESGNAPQIVDPENEAPTQRTAEALAKMQQMGVIVGIATGRDAPSTLMLAEKVRGMSFVVGSNGGKALRVTNGETLYQHPAGPKESALARDFLASLRRNVAPDMPFNVEVVDTLGILGGEENATMLVRDRAHDGDQMDWTRWAHMPHYNGCLMVDDLVELLGRDGVHATGTIYAYAPSGDGRGGMFGPDIRELWSAYKECEEGQELLGAGLVTEGMGISEPGPINVSIMNLRPDTETEVVMSIAIQGCDKWVALDTLCTQRGISKDDVLVFGNDYNDIGMLAWAGRGVAMAGSPAQVLKAADEVTKSAAEEGIAVYLEGLLARRSKI